MPTVRARLCALLVLSTGAAFPLATLAADDREAERESRRIENEMRRQDAQARWEIEQRTRIQADALRSQQQAISRLESAQARMLADSEERARQSAEQVRIFTYPYYPDRPAGSSRPPGAADPAVVAETPIVPATPLPAAPTFPSNVRENRPPGEGVQSDPVSRISFAPAQSGVAVTGTGSGTLFGLQAGDVILSIDGRAPLDGAHAAVILRSYLPWERLRIRVLRNGRTIELDAVAP